MMMLVHPGERKEKERERKREREREREREKGGGDFIKVIYKHVHE